MCRRGATWWVVGGVRGMGVVCGVRTKMEWTGWPDWCWARYWVSGALVSAAAQVGDLVASCFKRDADVKDSGRLFPGHGGALDRFDGFLFAAPVLYYMVVF